MVRKIMGFVSYLIISPNRTKFVDTALRFEDTMT